jgi:hypothetical protein
MAGIGSLDPRKESVMLERLQTTREREGAGPGGVDDIFGPGDASPGTALISSGIHMASCPAGLSVRELRRRYADAYEIGPSSTALLDGNEVSDESTVVREGQSLTFVARVGEKGARRHVA